MKKATRILAFLMAFAMLIGSFSVMGSAYEAYKGKNPDGSTKLSYNDVDAPVFTTEQAASMALDELDRMLAKEQIYLNIYVGELDLRSTNAAIASVAELIGKLGTLLDLLGTAKQLNIGALTDDGKNTGKPKQRTTANGAPEGAKESQLVEDVEFITMLLDFLGDNAPIFEAYVNGDFNLGIMNGFVKDFIFDVRPLVLGLAYSLTDEGKGYDFLKGSLEDLPEQYRGNDTGAINLIQTIVNELVLGDWVMLDNYFADGRLKANVTYDMYSFADDYDEEAPDLANYDYYGYVHEKDWVLVGLGGCARVPAGATAPAPVFSAVDVRGNVNGYDFIETLLQRAFNYVLVPVLNNQTRHALREWCGVVYEDYKRDRTVWDAETGTWKPNPTYVQGYQGETFDPETQGTVYNDIFNVNAYVELGADDIPAGTTLISNINDIFGKFLGARPDGTTSTTGILKHPAKTWAEFKDGAEYVDQGEINDWSWQFGSNAYLFTNIAKVAKYVLQITGDLLFAEYVDVPSAEELEGMNDQAIVAFILRAIFNASVDWLYIPDDAENSTILGVCYSAVEQLAYQDIPQYTYERPLIGNYTDPQDYYDAIIDQALNILLDVAVYNLNQSLDANPESGAKAGEGLIPYSQEVDGTWEDTAVMVAKWAVKEYGPLLAIYKDLHTGGKNTADITMEHVWADIDTIINSLIPVIGPKAWISSEISGQPIVSKAFIFDYILKPVYTLNATNFSKIFDRNETGDFMSLNGVQIIVKILENVFDLLFPNVFTEDATMTVDKILQPGLLSTMISDLLRSLGTKEFTGKTNGKLITGRAIDIATVALPVVNMLLGLSGEQEFEEIEIYMPEVLTAGEATTFSVYNGSSGINTAYTNAKGDFKQDDLYVYTITEVSATRYPADGSQSKAVPVSDLLAGDTFAGGESKNATLANTIQNGDIVEFTVKYKVMGETGTNIGAGTEAGDVLTKTVYSYVGATDEDDSEIIKTETVGDRKIEYSSEIYLDQGDDLDDIEGFNIRIIDNDVNKDWEDPNPDDNITTPDTVAVASIGSVGNTNAPFVASAASTANLTGQSGTYFLNPFKLAEKSAGVFYERYEEVYQYNENGELVLDGEGNPVIDTEKSTLDGVTDGDYSVTLPVVIGDVTTNLTITIHLYDDFGLPGAFESAVSRNRQITHYDTTVTEVNTLWANYTTALKNSAKLALTPKTGSNFQEFIGKNDSSDDFVNYYEREKLALETAIAALETHAKKTGVDSLKDIIASLDGYNYDDTNTVTAKDADGNSYTFKYKIDKEYYETGYTFFGERDYMPHLYGNYRDARRAAQSLIDSQEIFVMAPETCVDVYGENYKFSEEEKLAYNESINNAIEAYKNMPVIDPVEAAYAEHMLNLTSSRLIKLEASKDKLNKILTMCALDKNETETLADISTGEITHTGAGYTEESWLAYTRAWNFAYAVNQEKTVSSLGVITLSPTKVNIAMSELIEAWKKLVEAMDFTDLINAIEDAKHIAELGEDQTVYTPESYEVFMNAYNKALAVDRTMGKTDSNVEAVAEIVADLTSAQANLENASVDPEFKLATSIPSNAARAYMDRTTKLTFVPTLVSNVSGSKHKLSSRLPAKLPDGTPVDDLMIGFGMRTSMTYVKGIAIDPASVKNCTVEYNNAPNGKWTTGAYIQIKDNSGAVYKTYQVILYGDMNLDTNHTTADTTALKQTINAGHRPNTNPQIVATYYSGDLNHDGRLTSADTTVIKLVMNNKVRFDQNTGLTVAV